MDVFICLIALGISFIVSEIHLIAMQNNMTVMALEIVLKRKHKYIMYKDRNTSSR